MLEVRGLRTEHLENPLGLDAKRPRLGWKLVSDGTNILQAAYQVQASHSEDFAELIWDSGRVESDQSLGVRYAGPELRSLERIWWRVKVWSNRGEESDYSAPAFFETGLLSPSDWQARWIEPETEVDIDAIKPAPYLRKEFTVKKGLISARACMTARGLYRFYLNGVEGTDHLFTPGFTSYHKRLQVQVYDVTSLLREGRNALGVILGDGWWRGHTGGANLRNNFGYKLAFLGQLVLRYDDGSVEVIGSDGSFKASTGPLLKSDMKEGEIYDARISLEGWNRPGYDDSSWTPVVVTGDGYDHLIGTRSVPVRQKERFAPKVLRTPNGETVLDFGQNLAGWVEMQVSGEASAVFGVVLSICISTFLLSYLIAIPAAVRLRTKFPDVPRPFRVPVSDNGFRLLGGLCFFWILLGSWVAVFPGTLERMLGMEYDFFEIWGVSQTAFEVFTLGTLAALGVLGGVGYVRARKVRMERVGVDPESLSAADS